ncbi:MAG: exosortase/archaeosortase family protein [Desulfuromonadales bacterium]|nr:exosortase/archaeosortase family protein [Desulfuromonadales bacterium]
MNSKCAYLKDFPKINLLFLLVALCATYATIVPGMVSDWYHDENYSHGFLVPLISAYFLSQNWADLETTPLRPSNSGLLVIIGSLLLLLLGFVGTEYFTMRSSLVFLLAGIVLYWFGWGVLRLTALPIVFLIFMVPIPYIVYDAVAFPLKLLVTQASVAVLKMLSVPVVSEGNIIMFPQTVLEVADACSGLRSLMSLVTLAVAMAFLTQKSAVNRTILILSAVPVAIVTNMFRVIVTGFLASHYGAAAAEGFFHEFAGMAVFVLAMVILFAESAILRKAGR